MTDVFAAVVVILAGLGAGVINTVAGSGSLITLPLLIFLGLPATVANGTNRVAILFQTAVGAWRFRQAGKLDMQNGKILLLPSCIGAIAGAVLAVDLPERSMRLLIAAVMVLMFIVILSNPKTWLKESEKVEKTKVTPFEIMVHLAIGFYGGLIQAGVGVFLIAGLVMASGYDLLRANALKLMFVMAYTPLALGIFIYYGQVNWYWGFLLTIGNVVGAWIGSKLALEGGAAFLRKTLLAVIAISAIKLLYDVIQL